MKCLVPEYCVIGRVGTITPFYLYPVVLPVPEGYFVRMTPPLPRGMTPKLFKGGNKE